MLMFNNGIRMIAVVSTLLFLSSSVITVQANGSVGSQQNQIDEYHTVQLDEEVDQVNSFGIKQTYTSTASLQLSSPSETQTQDIQKTAGWNLYLPLASKADASFDSSPLTESAPTEDDTDDISVSFNTSTAAPTISSESVLYLSLSDNKVTTLGTLSGVRNTDIIKYDGTNFEMVMDGADVGVFANINAFHMVDADTILFNVRVATSLPDVGNVDDSDIIQFDATSLGETTAGSFSLYFDGSDVGLGTSDNSERIDAFSVLDDGRLLISTHGNPSVPGVPSVRDEDVLAFTPTGLGSNTSGTWAMYLDADDIGLVSSDHGIDAIHVSGDNTTVYLSTRGTAASINTEDDDIAACILTREGEDTTICGYYSGLYFDGSAFGLKADDIDGLSILGSSPSIPTPTPTATAPSPINSPTPTPTATSTLGAPVAEVLYLSLSDNKVTTVGTLSDVRNTDIIKYDGNNFEMVMDGADVGVFANINAFHMADADTILFTVRAATNLPDVGNVDDSDIIQFDATSLGETTAGSFSLYFDGSDVGLETSDNSERIDAFSVLTDGRLLISTHGNPSVPGVSSVRDEDVLAFTPTGLGNKTSGTWTMYLDADDIGLTSSEHGIDAMHVSGDNTTVYLSTKGTAAFINTENDDIKICALTSEGTDTTICNFQSGLYFDGSAFGLTADGIDGLSILGSSPSIPTPTATAIPDNTPTPTATTPPNTPTHTPTPTPTATSTPEIPEEGALYLSLSDNKVTTVGTLSDVRNTDIIKYDGNNFEMVMDGADVGVFANINAFHMVDADTILFTVRAATNLPDVGNVDDSDIIQFDATSLGETTAGSFSLYFDGSDVGLGTSDNSERIDAFSVLNDGRLLISTHGNPSVSGVSSVRDEDVLAFTPTGLGSNTSGTWAMYLDADDIGLTSSEHGIDAMHVSGDNTTVYLSTKGTAAFINTENDDIKICALTSEGTDTTICNFQSGLYFDGSAFGLTADGIDGLSILGSSPSIPIPTATAIPDNTPTPTATMPPTSTPMPGASACNPTNGSGGLAPGRHDTTIAGVRAVVVVGDGYNPNTPTYLGFHVHGDGGRIVDSFLQSSNPVTKFVNNQDWIFVAPQAPNSSNIWWKDYKGDHIEIFADVLDHMFRKYNVCRDMVFGSSGSGGGVFWSGQFFVNKGGQYPAHVVLSCGASSPDSSDRKKVNALGKDSDIVDRTSFFYYYGAKDKIVPPATIEDNMSMYENAGFDVGSRRLSSGGHCNEWPDQGLPNQKERIAEKWGDWVAEFGL